MKPGPAFARALYDYFFLLSRGYPWRAARDLVAARHGLGRRAKILLYRCVAARPPQGLLEPRGERLRGCLAVDTFNQLSVLYAALTGWPVYRCLDGLTRDAMLAGPSPVIKSAEALAMHLAAALQRLKPEKLVLVLDSQPSRSGEAAARIRGTLYTAGFQAETVVTPRADSVLLRLAVEGCVVATSDTVVASAAPRVLDLAGYTLDILGLARAVTDIRPALWTEHTGWCRGGPVA